MYDCLISYRQNSEREYACQLQPNAVKFYEKELLSVDHCDCTKLNLDIHELTNEKEI